MAKIAIIEDDASIAQMYRMKFEAESFEVGVASDGKKGLELVKSLKPDLILLDLMLPEMTGEEVLEKLRGSEENKKTLVIILTNVSKDEASSKIHQLGVSRYIVKAHHTPAQVAEIARELIDNNEKSQ